LCAFDAGVCHIDPNFFSTIKMILGLFCMQNDAETKYCIPSFFDFVHNKPVGIPALTAQLTSGCDECTLKVFQVWSRTEPLKAALNFLQLSTVCLQRAGEFCVIHQMELDNSRQAAGADCSTYTDTTSCSNAARGCHWNGNSCDDLWTVDKLTPMCHPCTLVYVNRQLVIMKLMDAFGLPDPDNARRNSSIELAIVSFFVNGVCSTDLKDQFCMPKLQANPPDFSCGGMANTVKTVGCCAQSLLDFVQGVCNVETTLNPAANCQANLNAVNSEIQSCTGLTLGKSCAEIKYILLHQAILSGIDPNWLTLHQDVLIVELKKAIAFAIGIDVAYITELKIAAALTAGRRLLATGDLQVTSTITLPLYSASQSAAEGLQGNIDPLGVNDAIQTTSPSGSLANASIVGQSYTNIAVVNQNGASSATPTLAALVAVAYIFCL